MAIEKSNPVPPFVSYCATLIPTVFDDSLSYYEALCALSKWLQDNLVNVVNNNADVTESYIKMTEEMKTYMDNYFDNLDVQEEIDHKLDEMAEGGQLEEIISAYLQANVATVFDTVADMKASTGLINGSYARTLGFRSINDGGGATYYITDTGTADEMQTIAVGDLYANLVLTTTVTPEMFGAYGDNTHDDSAAFQKAIDSGRDTVCLPKTYLIASTVELGDRDNFNFDCSSSTIYYSGIQSAFLIKRIYGATVKFGKLVANNGSCISAYSSNGTTSPADYIIYLNIHFELLRAKYNCISFEVAGTGIINEVRIRGGQMAGGDYGIKFISDANHDFYPSNGFYCENIGFEGTDVNYYFKSPYHRFAGIVCQNDRYGENVESTHIKLEGKFSRCSFTGWGYIDESRLDLSNDLLGVYFNMPVRTPDQTKIFAQGFYYDIYAKKMYNFDAYDRYTPSNYGEHVTAGNIQVEKCGNLCFIRLNGITGDTNSMYAIDSEHPLPERFRPSDRNKLSIATSIDGKTATVNVKTDGTIQVYGDASNTGVALYGEVVYDPLTASNANY